MRVDTLDTTTCRLRRVVLRIIVLTSFTAICGAMVMTVGDIIVRTVAQVVGAFTEVRPRWGLHGLVDLTQLAIMTAAPLAIAAAFFLASHIRVDIVFHLLPERLQRFSMVLSVLIATVLLGFCLWTAWREMIGQLDFTTTSATLNIAYTWYWVPLILGLALSVIGSLAGLVAPSQTADEDV